MAENVAFHAFKKDKFQQLNGKQINKMFVLRFSFLDLTWIIEISKFGKLKWFGFQFWSKSLMPLNFFKRKYAKAGNLSYRKCKITKAKCLNICITYSLCSSVSSFLNFFRYMNSFIKMLKETMNKIMFSE